jgi:hypothetical protein
VSGKPEQLGDTIEAGGAQWLIPENHQGMAPMSEAGIVVYADGTPECIKSSRWRPEGSPPSDAVHEADTVALTRAIREGGVIIPAVKRRVGLEIERVVVDDMQPFNLYIDRAHADPWVRGMLRQHPELFKHTLESSVGPFHSIPYTFRILGKNALHALVSLPRGTHIDPASAQMMITPTETDLSPNNYTLAMARELGPLMLLATGHGFHEHHDMHAEYIPLVTKYLRVLAPLLNAGLLAAPFGFGELAPRLGEILDSAYLRDNYDGRQPHSIRYPVRLVGGEGGVGRLAVHSTLKDMLSYGDLQFKQGSIHMLARLYGHFTDVRPRLEPPSPAQPDHPGRVELCVKDTAAGRLQTLYAWTELSSAVIRQLELVAAGGESAVRRLHSEFSRLVGTEADDVVFAGQQLPRAEANSFELAYKGADATITDGLGNPVTVRRQIAELIRFAEAGNQPLPDNVKEIIYDSLLTVEETLPTMRQYKDESGAPSLIGYYRTGKATPAVWMIARKDALLAQGESKPDIMRDGTLDRVLSYEQYMAELQPALLRAA